MSIFTERIKWQRTVSGCGRSKWSSRIATAILVNRDIDIGREILAVLNQANMTDIPNGSIDIMEAGDAARGTSSQFYGTYASYPSETFRVLNESVGDSFVEDA